MSAQTQPPAPDRLLTAEEYAQLPEVDGYRDELVRGRVVREPSPGWPHGRVQSLLSARLVMFVEEHDLGYAGVETGFIIERGPDTVRGPDVWYVSRERLGDEQGELYAELGPDLAVEVLSPSNRPRELAEELAQYFGAGTRLAWVIDPKQRRAQVYRPGREVRALHEQDELEGEDVVPGFRCRLADVLGPPPPTG